MKERKMKVKRIRGRINALLLCAAIYFLPLQADAGEIRLSIAASLKDAVTELSEVFTRNHPGETFQMNSGASGALAKQIEMGAPADIFLSANLEWMDYLEEKGLVNGKDVSILAYNSLLFIGRPSLNIKTLKDLVLLEKIAIATPGSAPAGEYAMTALSNAGIYKQLEKKLVMARDVRECIIYAERGEVDGAFVYKTDAQQISERLKILLVVSQDLYPRVTYPVGLTNKGAGNKDARAFFEFLQSEGSRIVLSKYGFIIE
jgi:molybdate transport system substrate-binding protein